MGVKALPEEGLDKNLLKRHSYASFCEDDNASTGWEEFKFDCNMMLKAYIGFHIVSS